VLDTLKPGRLYSPRRQIGITQHQDPQPFGSAGYKVGLHVVEHVWRREAGEIRRLGVAGS